DPREERAGDARAQQRVAVRDHMHRADQFDRLGVFHEKAARACADRVGDVLVEFEGRHDHDVHAVERGIRDDPLGRPETVAVGHPDVHEQPVGLLTARECDRIAARGRLTDHEQVGLRLEQAAEARPDELLIVGNRDADHAGLLSMGNSAVTRKPPSVAVWNTPPSCWTRSRMPSKPRPGSNGATRPSSRTSMRMPPGARVTRTSTLVTQTPCRATSVTDSSTNRYAAALTGAGTSSSPVRSSTSISAPGILVAATSVASWARSG